MLFGHAFAATYTHFSIKYKISNKNFNPSQHHEEYCLLPYWKNWLCQDSWMGFDIISALNRMLFSEELFKWISRGQNVFQSQKRKINWKRSANFGGLFHRSPSKIWGWCCDPFSHQYVEWKWRRGNIGAFKRGIEQLSLPWKPTNAPPSDDYQTEAIPGSAKKLFQVEAEPDRGLLHEQLL